MQNEKLTTSDKNTVKKILFGLLLVILVMVIIFLVTPLRTTISPEYAAPDITLEILSGPELDPPVGKYVFWVAAVVTGEPEPGIIFNRYDDPDQIGAKIISIWLESGEQFVLVATAENKYGKATSQLELTVGTDLSADDNGLDTISSDASPPEESPPADETTTPTPGPPAAENQPPVIADIVLSKGPLVSTAFLPTSNLSYKEVLFAFPVYTYDITAVTSDPDGDELTHEWTVSGGQITYYNCFKIKWAPPAVPGDYDISVTARDGQGGETVKTVTLPVGYVTLPALSGSSGFITKNQGATIPGKITAGDDHNNRILRGFISFDISILETLKIDIESTRLRLASPNVQGNPSFMHGAIGLQIWILRAPWDNFTAAQFDVPAMPVAGHITPGYTNYDITHQSFKDDALSTVKYLQEAINDGHERLVFRLQFTDEISNNNSKMDAVEYTAGRISLRVTFLDGMFQFIEP